MTPDIFPAVAAAVAVGLLGLVVGGIYVICIIKVLEDPTETHHGN